MMLKREIVLAPGVRVLALVPAACWVINLLYNVRITGQPGVMMWMCHTTSLVLMVGLAGSFASWIRLATIWATVGLPVWLISVAATNVSSRVAVPTHLLVPAVGWMVVAQLRMDRRPLDVHLMMAGGYLFIVQAISRFITDPRWNVNLVFRPYDPLAGVLKVGASANWVFMSTLLLAQYALGVLIFRRLFPAPSEGTATPEAPTSAAATAG